MTLTPATVKVLNMNNKTAAEISQRIMAQVMNGKTVREAIDAVIGAGAAEKLIGEVYDALRSKAQREGSRVDLATALAEAETFPRAQIHVVRRYPRGGGVRYEARIVRTSYGRAVAACSGETVEQALQRAHKWLRTQARGVFSRNCYVLEGTLFPSPV